MPLIRKVVEIGTGKAVFLPKSWLEYYEEVTGEKIRAVAIEVNRILTITPYVRKRKRKERAKNDQQG